MKIYTKTGDTGETGLFGGSRVSKDHLRIQAYGGIDELNALLGATLSVTSPYPRLKLQLEQVQRELFQLGAELATPPDQIQKVASKTNLISEIEIQRLETEIDEMEKTLPPLKNFILPSGSPTGAHLHLARTVCRRAERDTVTLYHTENFRLEILHYLNRLSDWLFVLARFVNHEAGVAELEWHGK